MQDELLSIAKKAVDAGAAAGVQCEAFVQKARHTSISVEGGNVTFGSMDGDYGIGLRVIKDRRTGYAYCSDATIDFGLKQAIAATRFGKPGDYAFHGDKDYAGARSLFDNRIASLVPEDGISLARDMMEGASCDKRAFPARGGIGFGTVAMAVANSNGVAAYDEGTMVSGSIMSLIKESGMVANGSESDMSRFLDINFEKIGNTATERAASQLNQKGIETAPMTVIMRPSAAFDIFCNTVAPALYGSAVKKYESVYAGKIGKQVAAKGLTILDDGTFDKGLNTYAMDEEGYPSRKNVLVEDGILKMFLYDEFSAIESGTKPTGSAMHADRLDASTSYKVPPTTCARNIIFNGPTMSEEKMIRDTKNGVLVLDVLGAHTANRASGDFSVAIYAGYAIKDGELAYPLKGGMIGGNMPQMLMNAELADNYKLEGSGLSPATGYMPSIKFENIRVSGE
ncbi:MAG TPA: TldD/PmbA family protein [Methanocella sp.]|uniref:TldD/PmbA family protein n=1 Tax=Methanocella sp. TaxID=2052833 RepID=UPI002D0B62DC|nr:TldD/PmbA family protein [Methanocella sp.]HTY91968.1 TldD/PmbA family protein [Methanocella sp.]